MRRSMWALAGAAALLAPGVARADDLGAKNFANCNSGLQICAGSTVTLVDGTHIVVKVWNIGSGDLGSRISGFGLYNLGVGATLTGAVYHNESGDTDVSSSWVNGASTDLQSGAGTQALDFGVDGATGGVGIVPCAASGGSPTFATCPGDGSEYVAFTFTLDSPITAEQLANAEWGFRGQSLAEPLGSTKCFSTGDTGDDGCITDPPPTTTTPEPVSMTLLATGLVGMGGAGAARRRKKNS